MQFILWDKKNKRFVRHNTVVPPTKDGEIYYSDGEYEDTYGSDLHITLSGRVLHSVFDLSQEDKTEDYIIICYCPMYLLVIFILFIIILC